MIVNEKESLWVEKYRPSTLEDCILPSNIKSVFDGIRQKDELPNMILAGGPGQGKTTVAKALCDDMNYDWILINASNEGTIATLRTTITQFASSLSLEGNMKAIILDEADYMSPVLFQPALRGALEEFSKNCRFIMTCNYPNKIIPALHSRCAFVDYQIPNAEKPALAAQSMARLKFILERENVKYDNAALAQLVMKYFPDFRRIINECQRYASIKGQIDADILNSVKDANLGNLVAILKGGEYKKMLQWTLDNEGSDVNILLRRIFDSLYDYVEPNEVPNAVLMIADGQHKAAVSPDPRIQFVATMTNLMSLKFK